MTTKLIVSPPAVQREMAHHPHIIREIHADVLRDLMSSMSPIELPRGDKHPRRRTCV